jgi:tetratricopeptide (TPR) repeat protein
MLLIVTCRPDFVPFDGGAAEVTTLVVTRLNRTESGKLIRQVAGGKALPDQLLGQIQTKTDGVPLFVEELTKTVLESGGLTESPDRWLLRGPTTPLSIPASLQDSLMARLDRLGWAKELAQVAAALGREFSHAVFVVVAERATRHSARLQDGMARLTDAQLLFRRGAGETMTYHFKHALVQDAAYASMLHSRRRELHRCISEVLETTFPEIAETQPEMVAHHLTEAQLDERAITWWRRAGQRNVYASANVEAIVQFERCLALLAKLPEGGERDAVELDIRIDLGVPLMGTVGYTAPEFQDNTRRAMEICERNGDQGRLYPVLWGQVAQTFSSGDVANALPMAERFLRSAERQSDRQLRMIGHRLYGMTLYGHGDLQLARHHLERAVELYDRHEDVRLTYAYGADQRVAALSYLGRTLHQLGYPEQGVAMVEEAMMAARSPGHVNTIIYAQACMLEMRLMRRELGPMAEEAAALAELAQGHAARTYQIVARTVRYMMDLDDTDVGDALEGIAGGIRELRSLNWNYWATRICLAAAEACAEAGRVSHGRDWLEQARSLIEGLGQDLCLPELYRLRASMLRAENAPTEDVEVDLRRAVATARAQSARWSELRSTIGLSRLLRDTGKPADAAALLGPLCASYIEGGDLPDLIEAKDLLDSLRNAM